MREVQLPRSVALDTNKRIHVYSEPNAHKSSGIETRIWMKSLDIFGLSCSPVFKALNGGEVVEDIKDPTAAAILEDFHFCPTEGPEVLMTLRLGLKQDEITQLKEKITSVIASKVTGDDLTIKFGEFNDAMELKDKGEETEWGGLIKLDNFKFSPMRSNGSYSIDYNIDVGDIISGLDDRVYEIEVSLRGMMFASGNEKSFDVVHETIDSNGCISIYS